MSTQVPGGRDGVDDPRANKVCGTTWLRAAALITIVMQSGLVERRFCRKPGQIGIHFTSPFFGYGRLPVQPRCCESECISRIPWLPCNYIPRKTSAGKYSADKTCDPAKK